MVVVVVILMLVDVVMMMIKAIFPSLDPPQVDRYSLG